MSTFMIMIDIDTYLPTVTVTYNTAHYVVPSWKVHVHVHMYYA